MAKNRNMLRSKLITISMILAVTAIAAGWCITYINMLPVPKSFSQHIMTTEPSFIPPMLLDRNGVPLNRTYSTKWNQSDQVSLHKIPLMLQEIFILSEDHNFYHHSGIDWIARLHALFQNIAVGRAIRGASTITEQVIRMIHPRKRTIWSRWVEGFEARELEKISSKQDILEFYLNQVPYTSNRRGVVQAARFYFDRSLETLSEKELLALATLVRAPSAYDLYSNPGKIDHPLNKLAQSAITAGVMTASKWNQAKKSSFNLKDSELCVDAHHFVRHIYNNLPQPHCTAKTHIPGKTYGTGKPQIITTLDGTLQNRVKDILSTTLKNLKSHHVANGAVLIAEHGTGEIVAWVVASNYSSKSLYNTQYIDAIKALRQPGSAMKPFLYALALEKGWSAATLIDDSPLKEPVGVGIHTYHNYSNIHYGVVTLRNALGNSLNIPAVKTIRFTGVDAYLKKLKELGITTLTRNPDFYGDGLALGNGEVSLYDMVQAYSVLANSGKFIPLSPFYNLELKKTWHSENLSAIKFSSYPYSPSSRPGINLVSSKSIFSKEVSSIIGNILSDPAARELEFGESDFLSFPVQSAVKTGTSSDYKDAWAMGYNSHYTAGVWMGNLDGTSTVELTGSRGPAFVLRSLFAELNRMRSESGEGYGNRHLYMSPDLVQKDICLNNRAEGECVRKTEWFVPDNKMDSESIQLNVPGGSTLENKSAPKRYKHHKEPHYTDQESKSPTRTFGFINPVNGLRVAMDPRIPDELEYMEFKAIAVPPDKRIKWVVDGETLNREEFKNSKIPCSTYNFSASRGSKFKNSRCNDTIQWKIKRGDHRVEILLVDQTDTVTATESVNFMVK